MPLVDSEISLRQRRDIAVASRLITEILPITIFDNPFAPKDEAWQHVKEAHPSIEDRINGVQQSVLHGDQRRLSYLAQDITEEQMTVGIPQSLEPPAGTLLVDLTFSQLATPLGYRGMTHTIHRGALAVAEKSPLVRATAKDIVRFALTKPLIPFELPHYGRPKS